MSPIDHSVLTKRERAEIEAELMRALADRASADKKSSETIRAVQRA